MESESPPSDPDAYAEWINPRIGAELCKRREAQQVSAYTMGKSIGGTSDQTILNIEQGLLKNGPILGTVARICARLGTTISEVVASAEKRA
jgi:DNA-binding XRE family transcriptional regulator